MSERLKRILLIVLFVLFAGATAYGLYVVFFRAAQKPTAQIPGGQNATGTLPTAGTGGPTPSGTGQGQAGTLPTTGETNANQQPGSATPSAPLKTVLLSQSVSQQISRSSDGTGARFYNPQDGKFYKVSVDGLITPLSDTSFSDVTNVAWGNTSDQAILAFPDGRKIHYDFTSKTQTTLPSQWDGFAFSQDDQKIVAKNNATSPESRYLILSDPNGKNSQAIEPLGNNQDKVTPNYTPNGQIIAYATTGQEEGFDRQQIILVGKNHENFAGLLVEGRGFEPIWSPSGNSVVYSIWNIANGYRPELWISGGAPGNLNQNRIDLKVQTWAHKCAWENETVIVCGVPEQMPEGAGLQPSEFATLVDRIVEINTETGYAADLGKPEGDLSVKDPVITKDGSNFMFTDVASGRMYAFKLQ
ncbi:MAG: hypothetical protein WC477_03525 [Patescibacteria group bacterium]